MEDKRLLRFTLIPFRFASDAGCQYPRQSRGISSLFRNPVVVLTFLTMWTPAALAIKVPSSFDRCSTLDSCLALLDTVVPAHDDGRWEISNVFARKLQRFGPDAKLELLKRATGSHSGWRRIAGLILEDWKGFDAADIPALRTALQIDQGGWAACALEKIATPDAIRLLVDDIPHGEANCTEAALERLGSKAMPYMLAAFEDDKASVEATRIVEGMRPLPINYATGWAATALDAQRPIKQRVAALRALAALGAKVEPQGEKLHGLLTETDPLLRAEAGKALRALRDPIAVVDAAKACQPSAERFDFLALNSSLCLSEIAEFGPAGHAAGEFLIPFLGSSNSTEQAYGILTLGFIGYSPATPRIETALASKDWRIVYAAISSVGWLGDKQAIPALNKLAADYWLVEIRKQAAHVLAALQSANGQIERGSWITNNQGDYRDPAWVITEGVGGMRSSCSSNRWRWQGQTFTLRPEPEVEAQSLYYRSEKLAGELIGTDHGEWGGSLTWVPYQGTPVVLARENVHSLDYVDGGAIVLFGLAHMGFNYGYVLKVLRNADGSWEQKDIARLPGEPQGYTRLDNDQIAVLTGGRVVVVSANDGILGAASCVAKP